MRSTKPAQRARHLRGGFILSVLLVSAATTAQAQTTAESDADVEVEVEVGASGKPSLLSFEELKAALRSSYRTRKPRAVDASAPKP
nr:hypothetical protein [Planctomycetota bacterium]